MPGFTRLYTDSSGQPDYGDKRAEIGGSDPGAMPGGSTSLRAERFGWPTPTALSGAKAVLPKLEERRGTSFSP